jgi:hypothetical protein
MNPRRRLRAGERAALLGVLVAATLGLAVAPAPLRSPIRKLANYRADGRYPIWNSPEIDGSALRRAGAIIPDSPRETYYIDTRNEPQLGHDLIGASLLFFLPARPVPKPDQARWILLYHTGPGAVPAGPGTYRLGDGIALVRLG